MAYHHDFGSFSFDHAPHPNLLVQQRIQYPGFVGQPLQPDVIYAPYAYHDVFDHPPPGLYPDGYVDDSNEPTTRPRLTPEQQAVLENQFLSNPKPSSATKKNLAQITKLSPARVANWFQNRRAKAKQQRKQEEFENSQQQQSGQIRHESNNELPEEDEDEDDDKQEEEEDYNKLTFTRAPVGAWQPKPEPSCPQPTVKAPVDVREMGYASLNRALAAAEAAAQHQATTRQPSTVLDDKFSMAPPEVPHQTTYPPSTMSAAVPQQCQPNMAQLGWCSQEEIQHLWASSPVNASDMNFDFGFDSAISQSVSDHVDLASPSNTTCSQTYGGMSPETWEGSVITPTMPTHSHAEYRQPLQSPGFPMPSYGSSRRPSIADSLTNNLEHIALTASASAGSMSSRTSDAGVGLAARRKRPGLAPLKGEALRSRSHGALTAASPTFRQGMTPPAAQGLRHVKSTGYSLNSQYQYGGVRKSSLPRKSPLAASFAEADFQSFLAQKMVNIDEQQQLTPVNATRMSQPGVQEQAMNRFQILPMGPHTVQVPEMPSRPHVASPPITPFQTDFFNMHGASMMPSSSIQAQYANAADWTPPYSAGPLTNSSLSDAPLTSPDFAHFSPFPPVQYIPSLSPIAHHQGDESHSYPWMFSADHSPQSVAMNNRVISNKSADDFKINLYEFPNQKEEHAQATKQLPRPPHQNHNVFVHESANYFNKDKSPK